MTRQTLLPDRIFDSITGAMLTDKALVVDGERVVAVLDSRDATEAVDLAGHTIVPGLIDVHTHLASPPDNGQGFAGVVRRSGAQDALLGARHADITLQAGFTTVRDVGVWRAFSDVALRDAIDSGWVPGPRMMVAGAYVTCPG
ncbi:MAG: amidohydrolase family protein, partial [Acidimicrobiia bacterium]